MKGNTQSEKIDYGYSRDHRPDAKQVSLRVNVTGGTGIPLGCHVLAGQMADRTTPFENLKALRTLLDRPELAERQSDFLLVGDRAMLDREVIAVYAGRHICWLGPPNADESLRDVMEAVSDEELEDHPFAYRPNNQPQDEP